MQLSRDFQKSMEWATDAFHRLTNQNWSDVQASRYLQLLHYSIVLYSVNNEGKYPNVRICGYNPRRKTLRRSRYRSNANLLTVDNRAVIVSPRARCRLEKFFELSLKKKILRVLGSVWRPPLQKNSITGQCGFI